ncbi:hypothetical protein ACWGE1_06000 [Streptomyces sp. NPDC054932]
MSTHEHRTGSTSGSAHGGFIQRTARAVVPFVTAFLIALFAAKIVALLTDSTWVRLATAMGVAVVSLLAYPYEEQEGRSGG